MFRKPIILAALCLSSFASAAVPQVPGLSDGEYRAMLKIAQLKVNRLNALRNGGANALSTSMIRSVIGRYYQPGDVWDVIACKEKTNEAAMTSQPTQVHHRCATFHYEVLELRPGQDPQIKVRITQKKDFGLKEVDPTVEALDLMMTDKFVQRQKTYHFTDESLFAASPNGVHTGVSSLELFPLDVPDIYTAEQLPPSQLPELPPELRAPAQQAGFTADLKNSSWYEQQDIFGREIQVLWQKGDLWPAYIKTPNGVAVLVRSKS